MLSADIARHLMLSKKSILFLVDFLSSFVRYEPDTGTGVHIEATGEDPAVQLLRNEQQHGQRVLPRGHARHGVRQGKNPPYPGLDSLLFANWSAVCLANTLVVPHPTQIKSIRL